MSRRARIITIIVAAVLLLLLLLLVEENWRGKRAWENTKRRLEAQGEHLDMAWFIPPPVPDEQNFSLNPILAPLGQDGSGTIPNPIASGSNIAGSDIREDMGWNHSKKTPWASKTNWAAGTLGLDDDMKEWQAFYREELPGVPLDKSPPEDVLTALGGYDWIFTGLREAQKTRPLSRTPLHYEKGIMMSMPQYSDMQNMIRILALRARAKLALNRPADAFEDVSLALRLLESIHDDPVMISGLVRITWVSMLFTPIWEGIALHRWTPEQLENIQTRLQRLDFLADCERTMRAERAATNTIWDDMRNDPKKLLDNFPYEGNYSRPLLLAVRFFAGFLYQNQAAANFLIQEKILPIVNGSAHRVSTRQLASTEEFFANDRNFGPYSMLAKISVPVYFHVIKKYVVAQAYTDLTIVACAIERFRIAHGALPATLDDLQMPGLPCDLITGAPLHYRVTGDGYLLYSVGWNGEDDGGTVVLQSTNKSLIDYQQGDWVWSLKPVPEKKP